MNQSAAMLQPEYKPVPRIWAGHTAFIIGGGTTLLDVDFERLQGERLIVINKSWRFAPWADILYFADRGWWLQDGAKVRSTFSGEIFTAAAVDDPRVNRLRNSGLSGLDLNPTGLRNGTNSGYQAINLAYHLGATRIVLLGYDMQAAENGKTHAHRGYGYTADAVNHIMQKRMLPYFASLVKPLEAAGVEVLNTSPRSLLDCWPKVTLESVLRK